MRTQRTHRQLPSIHALASVGAVALAALPLAACGGEQGTGGPDGAERASMERATLRFAECMRKQGIDVPDPKPGQRGLILRGPADAGDPRAHARAARKCDRHLRNVPPPQLSDDQRAENRDRALEHARCMREQGIDFPDPKFDEGGGAIVELGESFDPGDPRVREAEQKCRKHLPRPDLRPLR